MLLVWKQLKNFETIWKIPQSNIFLATENVLLFAGCNKTYYGTIGPTYSLELHRPKQDKIPYICILTFTAAGGTHGDIVQVMLIKFVKLFGNCFEIESIKILQKSLNIAFAIIYFRFFLYPLITLETKRKWQAIRKTFVVLCV